MSDDKNEGGPFDWLAALPTPVMFLVFIGGGLLLDTIWHAELPTSQIWQPLGWILIFAGGLAVLIAWTQIDRIRKNHESGDGDGPKVATTGVFEFTRNPIYLGILVAIIGAGIKRNEVWLLVSALPAFMALEFLVIPREEADLTEKFGEEYTSYTEKVRRWL